MSCVRKTYHECNALRSLFSTYGCFVDERDISIDRSTRDEFKKLMDGDPGKTHPVPQVFIGNTYLGGYTDITELNEVGALKQILEQEGHLHRKSPNTVCRTCGDRRFVVCTTCDGSRRVHLTMDGKDELRCPDCNENGLVRCPVCPQQYASPLASRVPCPPHYASPLASRVPMSRIGG
eukprot:CAMPEP_0118923768 /NCGR_PEP_ID=MMETSP1169-20130426/2171_1 /TAXON_ID=36882 /ORGANISM="Pyramimonas obovata, Strain CCMP722" /LENGTH=177 /DNA_ID=CAMNT_0006864805 /DNA_START=408 /DNA_END=941 /DNA_ORIENTATION=-